MLMLGHFLVMPVVFCLDIEFLGKEKQRTVEILRKYLDYQVIVHYDNLTARKMEEFFSVSDGDFPLILLFNYDNPDIGKKRPIGYKFLNLVYLSNPFDFEKFSSEAFSLKHEDVVLFVISNFDETPSVESNYQLKSVWMLKGLDSCGCVVLYDIDKDGFYYVWFYFGKMTGVLNKIPIERNNEKGSKVSVVNRTPNLLRYIDEFTNFNGHIFYVAYYPYAPFIWCDSEIVDGPGCNIKGIEGNMLLLLSKYLNFTFVMKRARVQTEDSIWKDMIEDVHFGRRDWAVGGMSTSSERIQLVDFTTMFHMESYTTFYISPEIDVFTWDSVLRPFKFITWIQLFVDIVCIGFVIKLMAMVYNISKYLHFKDSITIPFYVILEQSVLPNLRIRVFNLKLILSVWFLMSIIITTAYKSKLASTMIKPVKREPGSILELYDAGYTFQVNNEDWSVLEENLAHSTDQRYVNILDRCNNELKFCEAVAATLKRRAAVIDEDTGLQYIVTEILTTCHDYSPFEMSRFRLVKDYLFPSVHAWPLRYGTPYKFRFSITLQRLVDSGIIEHWYKSIISKPIRKSNTYHDGSTGQPGVLDINGFYGPLSILFAGELLGTTVFIGEIVYFKYLK